MKILHAPTQIRIKRFSTMTEKLVVVISYRQIKNCYLGWLPNKMFSHLGLRTDGMCSSFLHFCRENQAYPDVSKCLREVSIAIKFRKIYISLASFILLFPWNISVMVQMWRYKWYCHTNTNILYLIFMFSFCQYFISSFSSSLSHTHSLIIYLSIYPSIHNYPYS